MSWLERLRKPKPISLNSAERERDKEALKDAKRRNDAAFEELNRALEKLKAHADLSDLLGGE